MPENPNTDCRVCGKPFYCAPSRRRKGYGFYCSTACYSASAGTLEERLLKRRQIDPETDCWLWTGDRIKQGYGRIRYGQRLELVPRMALHVFRGFDLGSDLDVLHSCDNPPCFNPDHLRAGPHAENMADMVHKGRSTNCGRRCGRRDRRLITGDSLSMPIHDL